MPQPQSLTVWHWRLLFTAAGAIALGVQTYLLRELIVVLQGDEMAVGIGLSAWFSGIVVGASITSRTSDAFVRFVTPISLSLLGILGCTGLVSARFVRSFFGASAFEPFSFAPSLLVASGLFFVPGICVGATFVALATTAATAFDNSALTIGRLYVFEALGSLGAGLFTSLVLSVYLPSLCGLGLLVGLSLLCTLLSAQSRNFRGRAYLLLSALLAFVVALPPVGTSIERASEQVRFSALAIQSPLAAYRNTPYQHIALGGSQQHVLYTNGQYVTSFPDPVPNELLAHELMVFSEKPTRVLSFGGLETGALRHCLQHPVASVDLVLLDPDAFHLVSHYLSPADRAALDDPRVHIVFDDPRRFLSQPGPPYDLIISLDPDPNTLFLARATSLEFDRLVHSRLAQDGAYVARFSAGPNVQSGDLGRLGASLYRTLRRVFPVVLATPGPDALYVAGDSPTFITLDAKRLTQRYRDRQVTSEIFEPDFFSKLLPPERIATLNDELVKHAHSAKLASDNHPIAFMYALGVRQQIAGSAWVKLLHGAARYPKTVAVTLAIPSLLLFLYQRVRAGAKSVRTAALHAVAVTGASGLATNLVLMVSFQTRVGALYSELGVLNGLFMLGLALGGVFSTRDHRPEPLLRAQKLGWGTTSLLIVVLVFVDYLPAGSFLLWFIHVFMLLVVGFGTGSLFPAASRECLERLHAPVASNTRVVASNLEVWDHAGAAISALFSAVLLVPVLGLLRCIGVFLLLQTIALLLTRFENPPRRKN